MFINKNALFFLSASLSLTACKPGARSSLGSLDSLTNASLPPRECKGNTTGDASWTIDVIGYDASATSTLRAKAATTLAAAPPLLTNLYFKGLQGRIIVSENPLEFCSGFGGNDQKFAQGSTDKAFVCWNYEGKKESSSLDIGAQKVETAAQPPQPVISVSGDQNGLYVAHGLLRALGFLYISKIAELRPAANGGTPQFQPLDSVTISDLNKLTLSVVRDVKIAGINTKGSLYEAVFDQNFLTADEAKQHSMLQNESDTSLRYAKFVVFAETFDSYYCTSESRQSMLANNRFKKSYDDFQVFTRRFDATSSNASLALDSVEPMTAAMTMMVMQQMIASIGGNSNLNPLQIGLNYGGSGLMSGNMGVMPFQSQNLGGFGSGGLGTSNSEVVRLTNQQRQAQGLRALQEDQNLNSLCQNQAAWMARTNQMKHFSERPANDRLPIPQGTSTPAENIAMGQNSPTEVVNAWMNSPGHRANILTPSYTRIGAANSGTWWCQQFLY